MLKRLLAVSVATVIVLFADTTAMANDNTTWTGSVDVDGYLGMGQVDVSATHSWVSEEREVASSGGRPVKYGSLPPGLVRCFTDGQVTIRVERCPNPADAAPVQPTISDLASFKPQTPTIAGEPDGWALKGRPANFVAPVDAHVVAGTLLGRPADVRFTPVTWHWNFGDGSTATSSSGGDTWEHLGLPRFSTTPTSHVYRERSRYTVSLGIEYRADYRYDGGDWNPIEGTLTVPVGSEPVRVFVGSTVLTARGCDGRDAASC